MQLCNVLVFAIANSNICHVFVDVWLLRIYIILKLHVLEEQDIHHTMYTQIDPDQ